MNPAKAAPSAPVKQADDQQDTGHIDDPARFASDFRVRNPAQSAKVF